MSHLACAERLVIIYIHTYIYIYIYSPRSHWRETENYQASLTLCLRCSSLYIYALFLILRTIYLYKHSKLYIYIYIYIYIYRERERERDNRKNISIKLASVCLLGSRFYENCVTKTITSSCFSIYLTAPLWEGWDIRSDFKAEAIPHTNARIKVRQKMFSLHQYPLFGKRFRYQAMSPTLALLDKGIGIAKGIAIRSKALQYISRNQSLKILK